MAVNRDIQTNLGRVYNKVQGSQNGGSYTVNATVTTADGTATVILAVPCAEGEAVQIRGSVLGCLADESAALSSFICGGARRAAAGNVTAIGTPSVTSQEDHGSGTPAVTFNANTTSQELEIKVTGIAAEAWRWEGNFTVTKV